ncbi:hypothetical protein LCGC14_0911430 [marine sediment metagenome]|uniref:Uncharacterized protein n=1 Tax=marine sediment metagenome TaxID=412755 RepID=A0A0F9RCG9_9ZZZZ
MIPPIKRRSRVKYGYYAEHTNEYNNGRFKLRRTKIHAFDNGIRRGQAICGVYISCHRERKFVGMNYIPPVLLEKGFFCKNCQSCLQWI